MDDYQVIAIDSVTRKVSLAPPMPPKKIEGLTKLVQIVYLALLTNPGRNTLYPARGSGLLSLIGSNLDLTDETEIIADVSERLEKIKIEIIEAQSSLENETNSERIRDIIILRVEAGAQIDEIEVVFRLISEAGEVAQFII